MKECNIRCMKHEHHQNIKNIDKCGGLCFFYKTDGSAMEIRVCGFQFQKKLARHSHDDGDGSPNMIDVTYATRRQV
jgi:hypothetical protein